jgi:hypothetical protein
MLHFVILSVTDVSAIMANDSECHYAKCHYTECRGAIFIVLNKLVKFETNCRNFSPKAMLSKPIFVKSSIFFETVSFKKKSFFQVIFIFIGSEFVEL